MIPRIVELEQAWKNYYRIGDWESAKSIWLDELKECPEGLYRQMVLTNLASTFIQEQNYEVALYYIKQAMREITEMNHISAIVIQILGVIRLRLGYLESALQYFKYVERLFIKYNKPEQLGSLYCNMGVCYHELNDENSAQQYNKRGWAILQENMATPVLNGTNGIV